MPKTFALAAVLRLREQVEAAEERALLAVNGNLHKTLALMSDLMQQMDRHTLDRSAEVHQISHAAHHEATSTQWKVMTARKAEIEKQIHGLREQASLQQERFMRARRERELLTGVYEKHEKDRMIALDRSERKVLDDLFLARLATNSRTL